MTKLIKNTTCYINNLPSEILLVILQNLNDSTPSQLLQCALTCKSWSYYALQLLWYKPPLLKPQTWLKFIKVLSLDKTYIPYPSLVRRINLSAIPEFVSDDSLMILSACKELDRLTLAGCTHITNQGIINYFNQNLGQYLFSIDLSEIKHLSDETIITIAENCRYLQGLNLSVTTAKDTECFGVTDKSIIRIAENCRDLKKIRLSNWKSLTDESIIPLARNCPGLLEIDTNSKITNESLVEILTHCRELRELKLNHCLNLNDMGFLQSPFSKPRVDMGIYFDQLRILELTNVAEITDHSLDCITLAAPKLRNLNLNKCIHITDQGVDYIGRLGRYLHHLNLGSCKNITDDAVIRMVNKCNRIRYIDLSSCHRLGDDSVVALAGLQKLKRIGLVKCHRITNLAILALTNNVRTSVSLERIHLSYCEQLTVQAIRILVIHCRRLTHLSLSFIPAFQNEIFKRFCRPPPKDYNAEISSFCVLSGKSIHDLRNHFKATLTGSAHPPTYQRVYPNRLAQLSDGVERIHLS